METILKNKSSRETVVMENETYHVSDLYVNLIIRQKQMTERVEIGHMKIIKIIVEDYEIKGE